MGDDGTVLSECRIHGNSSKPVNEPEPVRKPTMGQIYRHFKGGEYLVLFVGKSTLDPTNKSVVYVPIEDMHSERDDIEPWLRPLNEWFEEVDRPEFSYKGERFVYAREAD